MMHGMIVWGYTLMLKPQSCMTAGSVDYIKWMHVISVGKFVSCRLQAICTCCSKIKSPMTLPLTEKPVRWYVFGKYILSWGSVHFYFSGNSRELGLYTLNVKRRSCSMTSFHTHTYNDTPLIPDLSIYSSRCTIQSGIRDLIVFLWLIGYNNKKCLCWYINCFTSALLDVKSTN